MVHAARTLTLATVLLAPLASAHAGTPVDPSGHWQGAIFGTPKEGALEQPMTFRRALAR